MVYFVENPDAKWEINMSTNFRSIIITAHKGAFKLSTVWWVSPPNFLERLFGITFEQKVEKAKKQVQSKIDKLNADIETANKIAGIKPFDTSNPPK